MALAKAKTLDLFGFGSSVVNEPQPIPIQNIPEGVVQVSDLYLWIRWTLYGRRDQHRIEAKKLYEWTKNPCCDLPMGKLNFRLIRGERNMICIEPGCSETDTLEVRVSLIQLREALRYFFE